MKIQKILMTGCRDMDKNIKNAQIGFFLQYVTPKDFFQKSASVTFVSLWCPNFMQNKTSIQWTPGSQIYRSNQKIFFSKVIFENNKKPINYA